MCGLYDYQMLEIFEIAKNDIVYQHDLYSAPMKPVK